MQKIKLLEDHRKKQQEMYQQQAEKLKEKINEKIMA